jgi:hypothetical protein
MPPRRVLEVRSHLAACTDVLLLFACLPGNVGRAASGPSSGEFMAPIRRALMPGPRAYPTRSKLPIRPPKAVNLEGWYSRMDLKNLKKWAFPKVRCWRAGLSRCLRLGQGWEAGRGGSWHTNCSGRDRRRIQSPSRAGWADSGFGAVDYPPQVVDISYGVAGTSRGT